MILSVTFSKPVNNIKEILGKEYQKIKIKIESSGNEERYFAEFFTEKQVFHKHLSSSELLDFINTHAGKTFKSCIQKTLSEEITILANKKGKITTLKKQLKENTVVPKSSGAKKKNYLLQEGSPIPFLVLLGIMTNDGKIISSKYDKFKQINRFLEFINDILPEFDNENISTENPLRIVDFGCGKSYLTFAIQYFLTEIKKVPCQIFGLDLKEDVINYCNQLCKKLNCDNLSFQTGDIETYSSKQNAHIIITLHACDTATDFALKYAVQKQAKVILSVPCCQHQVNSSLNKNEADSLFEPLLKWGIIKEKFASLVTDSLRGQWLEAQGYNVQMLEFIDMEHTPKNILIRAVKKDDSKNCSSKKEAATQLIQSLKITQELWK